MTALGGFDESLGIDAVDAAACLGLRAAGLSIRHLAHTARSPTTSAPGVRCASPGPRRTRYRAIAPSVARRSCATGCVSSRGSSHSRQPMPLRTLRRVAVNTALAVTVEDDRWAKAKASARGVLPRRAARIPLRAGGHTIDHRWTPTSIGGSAHGRSGSGVRDNIRIIQLNKRHSSEGRSRPRSYSAHQRLRQQVMCASRRPGGAPLSGST